MTKNPMLQKGKKKPVGSGKKKGSKNKRTVLLETLGAAGAEKLISRLADIALNGDPEKTNTMTALVFLAERLMPKGAVLSIEFPHMEDIKDVYGMPLKINNAVAAKLISPQEGLVFMELIEKSKKLLTESELLERLIFLEKEMGIRGDGSVFDITPK